MKRKYHRKGLELALSFIVILILTVVVFGGSIYFIRQFFEKAESARVSLDLETEAQIKALLEEGDIAIPIVQYTVRPGGSAMYGLGIKNTLNKQQAFHVRVGYSAGFQENTEKPVWEVAGTDDSAIAEFTNSNWLLYETTPFTLDNGKSRQSPILIKSGHNIAEGVRTVPGLYIFNVCVLLEEPATDYSCSNNDVTNSIARGRTARRNPCAGSCSDPLLYRNQAVKIQLVVT